MRWMVVFLAPVVAAAIGVGCGSAAEGQTDSPAIVDIDWLAETIGGRETAHNVASTIRFEGDGRVTGDAGCNRFGGSFTLEGDLLEIGPLAATKRMCPEEYMDQEDRFLTLLGNPLRAELTRDGYLLLYPEEGGEPTRLAPLAPEEPEE